MFKYNVTNECTALLGWKSDFRGVSESGFSSCTVPTYYCRSKYFQVIGNQISEVFPIYRIWIMEVGLMPEVTRGQVDNENSSQSQYLNMLNNIQSGGLYIQVREHSH